jgi:hypothetical protein
VRWLCLLALCSCNGSSDASVDLATAIAFTVTPDFVGFPTLLDGTQASGSAYHWQLIAPDGTTVELDGATASFEPGVGGTWSAELTVDSASATQNFVVPTAPIFFYQGQRKPEQSALGVIRSDGTGRRIAGCPTVGTGALGSMRFAVLYGMRTHDTQHVFLEIVPTPDMGSPSEFRLWAADENTDCMSAPPRRIDSRGLYNDHAHFWPRFSPDGTRVLYVDQPQDQTQATYRLVTINFDDTHEYIVRSQATIVGTPPIWLDGTHVAWVEDLGGPHLVIYQALDGNAQGDQNRTPLIDCGTQLRTLNQMELAGDALIVAASTPTSGATELYRIPLSSCSLAQKIAAVPPGNMAADLTVSPDGATVVFSSTGDQPIPAGQPTPRFDLWIVPTDGSQPPKFFAGDARYHDYGPRFIANGRQIVWTQALDNKTPPGAGLMIANLDGTHVRSLAAEDPDGGVSVASGSDFGTSCSFAPTGGSPLALLLLLGATACRRWRRCRRDGRPAPTGSRRRSGCRAARRDCRS